MGVGRDTVWDSTFKRTYAVQECKWGNDSTLGKEGGEGDSNFLKAGLRETIQPKFISPSEVKNPVGEIAVESDAHDEGEVEEAGDQVERSALGEDGGCGEEVGGSQTA